MNKRMAELQTNEGQVQETLSMEELSKKIQDATKELNQLKQGLNNLSLEEQNSRLAEIESSIFDCSESLEELENDNAITVNQEQLNVLKSKVNVLKSEKESLKQQIEIQVRTEMEALTKSVNTTPASEQNQENNEENSNGGEKKWLGRQREGLTSKQEWKDHTGKNILRALGGIGIIGGTAWLSKKLFTPKDYESKIPGYAEMSRKEKRLARRELRRQRREERSERRRERRESGEGRPRRQKFLIGSVIAGGTVIGGVEIYKHRNKISSWAKEKLGLALNFDQALYTVETEVINGINKDTNFGNMCAYFDGMNFDENTQEICSFGERVKINKKNKTIEGMDDVQFPSREELFHAANIINFAKRNLKGMGANDTPFIINKQTGDIDFSMTEESKARFISANGSNFWTEVLGLGGGGIGCILGLYFLGLKGGLIGGVGAGLLGYTIGSLIDNSSSMGRMCSTIAKGVNLQKFVKYLNEQNIWGLQEEQYESDDTTPMHKYFNEIKKEIDDAYSSGADNSRIRDLKLERDESQPSVYKIDSYYQEVPITLEGCTAKKGEDIDFSKITKISIGNYEKVSNSENAVNEESWGEGLNISFPCNENGLKEAIRTANLTNKIRQDRKYKCDEKYPFSYGKYKYPFCFEVNSEGWGTNHMGGTTILNQDVLKNKYPTIYQDLREFSTISSFFGGENFQERMHNQALGNENTGSQYIKYLHQMGKGKYWKNPN